MSRADWGSGTVYRHRDGWNVQMIDPSTGKRVSKRAKTKNEAGKLLRGMHSRVDRGQLAADSRISLQEWIDSWLMNLAPRNRRPSTVHTYEGALRTHVTPVLGRRSLRDLTVIDVERALDQAHKSRGLSRSSLHLVRKALSASLTDAVRARLLSSNVAKEAILPMTAAAPGKPVMPTSGQIQELLEITDGTELGRVVVLLATTGARIGEALGSRWADYDLENGTWVIERTLTRDRDGRYVSGEKTKNDNSRRVFLAEVAVQALNQQRSYVARLQLASRQWRDEDLVFPSGLGTPKNPSNFRRKWNAAVTQIPDWTAGSFHSLRHYFAGVGLARAHAAVVQQALGHSTLSMTTGIYGHLLPEEGAALPQAVASTLLRGSG